MAFADPTPAAQLRPDLEELPAGLGVLALAGGLVVLFGGPVDTGAFVFAGEGLVGGWGDHRADAFRRRSSAAHDALSRALSGRGSSRR